MPPTDFPSFPGLARLQAVSSVKEPAKVSAAAILSETVLVNTGIIAIAITIYLAYRFAATMAKLLGDTGVEVLVRLSAFILMCIGIEIIWNGLSTLTGMHA